MPVRLPLRLVLAGALALGTASCSGDPAPEPAPATASDDRLEPFAFDGGSVGVPLDWDELPSAAGTVGSFTQPGPDGQPVAQLDVIVSEVPPSLGADALDASAQSNRTLQVRDLVAVDREPVQAAGAADAFRTASTYSLPDGSPARSLEQSTVDGEGLYVLVRYSAGAEDYDADLAEAVLDSIVLQDGQA